MRRITTSSLFLVSLIAASLLALAQSADLVINPTTSASSPLSVAVARAYYAAVQGFFETGELSEVRAVTAPDLFDRDAASIGTGDLAFHLRGLRETYPALAFAVEEMTASGTTVISRLAITSGPSSAVPVFPLTSVQSWHQIETLRVSDGRIVEWHSIGPLFGSFVSCPGSGQKFPIDSERSLVAARMSFAGGESGHVALDAPALVIPEGGGMLLQGNGVALVFNSERPGGQIAENGIAVTVKPTETIVVPRGRAVLSAGSSMPSSALVVLFAPDRLHTTDREIHSVYSPPEQLLTEQRGGQVARGISITPLDRAEVSARGTLELIAGVVRIEPGNGMGVTGDMASILVLPQSGQISTRWDSLARRQMLVNEGRATAIAWVVGVRPVTAG